MRKQMLVLVGAACLTSVIIVSGAVAEGGKGADVVVHHKVAGYPDAISNQDDGSSQSKRTYLTRDKLEKVKGYFSTRLEPNDKLEPFAIGPEEGYTLINQQRVAERDVKVLHLTLISLKNVKTQPAFGQLQNLVAKGFHSQAEYDAVMKQYGYVCAGKYKPCLNDRKLRSDEGSVIFEKYYRIAYPDNAALADKPRNGAQPSSGNKPDVAALRAKMKELKAKGDVEGMLKLTQEMQSQSLESSGTANAVAETANKDTWATWVECLQEMAKVAYWTELAYEPGVLAE
jgi:hypothetical protein